MNDKRVSFKVVFGLIFLVVLMIGIAIWVLGRSSSRAPKLNDTPMVDETPPSSGEIGQSRIRRFSGEPKSFGSISEPLLDNATRFGDKATSSGSVDPGGALKSDEYAEPEQTASSPLSDDKSETPGSVDPDDTPKSDEYAEPEQTASSPLSDDRSETPGSVDPGDTQKSDEYAQSN